MNVPFVMGELESIVGQNDVDPLGHSGDQVAQKSAATIFPVFGCTSTKATLELRSKATKKYCLPSAP
jgi:hypothetical protein